MRRFIAAVTKEFQDKVDRLKHTVVYRTPAYKGGKKFLTMFAVKDPTDPDDVGYFYVERVGKDSVAIVFYDANRPDKPYIVLEQYHSPLRRFIRGAFTGSMDKPDLSAEEIAKEESLEEAGFDVPIERCERIHSTQVSANTNEQVHLFLIDVTDLPNQKIQPENEFEQNTRMYRMDAEQVGMQCEWKAMLLVRMHQDRLERNSLDL